MTTTIKAYIAAVALSAAAAAGVAAVFGLRDVAAADLAVLGALTLGLQLSSVRVPRAGRLGVSAVGVVACAIAFGAFWAIAVAFGAAVVQWVRSRGLLHRAAFDASQWMLSAGAAAGTYELFTGVESTSRAAAAFLAGLAFAAVNNTLLCGAIGLSEGTSPVAVWRERFAPARFYYLTYGPLALVWAVAGEALGTVGYAFFAIAPVLLLLSLRSLMLTLTAAEPAPARTTR